MNRISNQSLVSSINPSNTLLLIALLIMAMASPKLLFLFLCLHPLLTSGTLVGFSYHAKGNVESETLSFLKVSPSLVRVFAADQRVLRSLSNTGVSVDLYLSQTQAWSLINSSSSATSSWLEIQILNLRPHVDIRRIIVSTTLQRQDHDLPMLLSALKSIHSGLAGFHVDHHVKVSAAFSVSFLESLSITQGQDLQRICSFIKKTDSSIILEDSIEGELSMGGKFALKMVKRAELAVSVLSDIDVQILMTVSSSAVPSQTQLAELSDKVLKHLQNNSRVRDRVAGLYAEVALTDDLAPQKLQWQKEQTFPSSHREVLENTQTSHDEINPPNTVFPTTPVSTTPVTIPPDTPIVTVPATNPVTTTPTSPVPFPSTTPITVPSTDPVNSPLPITNPVTTPPVTNPVTTYPAPAANVPATNPVVAPPANVPVTNPVSVPPAMTNAPATPGQSWCVAMTGAPESSVQSALDYACGIGGADCAQIQQSGSCYNPNTLQYHASYAFNSYYQKNPSPSSCDFGGAATITNTNPSTGSCIFPSSSSSSSSTPPTSPVTTPITTPTPTTSSSSGEGVAGSGVPPMVLNSSDPASGGTSTVFGSEVPPGVNTSTMSISAKLQPFWGCCIVLVTSFVTQNIVL